MSNNGLKAEAYSKWIDKSITLDKKLNHIISEYVIGSPAYNVSAKGRSLYHYFGMQSGVDYIILFSELFGNLEVVPCDDYDCVKQAIVSDSKKSFSNTPPQSIGEWFCYYIEDPSRGKLYQSIIQEQSSSSDPPTWSPDEKKAVVKIEMLFRHIRNSFAHGRFTYVEKRKERYYILQDEHNNLISARMMVKQSTLEKWMEALNERRTRFLQTKNH